MGHVCWCVYTCECCEQRLLGYSMLHLVIL